MTARPAPTPAPTELAPASAPRKRAPEDSSPGDLRNHYEEVRRATEHIAEPLSPEDCAAQSMTDASPIQWHLAHTSWFFETFVLARAVQGYRPFHPRFGYLFNSYYNSVGERVARPLRGRMSRPGLEEIRDYRQHVDHHVTGLLDRGGEDLVQIARALETGLHHEQQHQELMLMDVKHLLSLNPLRPAYREDLESRSRPAMPSPLTFIRREGGLHWIGHGGQGFAFDNELPRHRVYTDSFEIASRPVSNGEFLEFVEAGGYRDPAPWLSDGWDWVCQDAIRAPLYWEGKDGDWRVFTLAGVRELNPSEPVAHISYYEADAYARWAGARLPREQEWELVASEVPVEGNFAETGALHPLPTVGLPSGSPLGMFGDLWEWTASPYAAYPGFRPAPGALGEYNGKFMCNRMVLRGGSCASPRSHLRLTYRNFFVPAARWLFSGIRLARDI